MSDFFTGQLLVFAALLPVLLRPYIRPLRDLQGIPLLALVAAAVCAGTAASGLRILFFPLFLFALIVFIFQIPGIVLLAKDIQRDAEERAPVAPSAVALAILALLLAVCAWFQPEAPYSPRNDIKKTTERATLSAGFSYRFNVFEMEEDADPSAAADSVPAILGERTLAAIIYFPSFPAGVSGRDTFLAMAADRGFTAIAVHWSGQQLYSAATMNPEVLRDLRQVAYALGQSFQPEGTEAPYVTRFARAQEGIMQTVVLDAARFAGQHLTQKGAGRKYQLFAVAEGYACTSLAAVMASHPDLFAGAAYLLSEEDAMNLSASNADSYFLRGLESPIPNSAADFPQIVITDARAGALGFAEMPADDPALASLLGIERDSGRRLARLAAERVLYWIQTRSAQAQ